MTKQSRTFLVVFSIAALLLLVPGPASAYAGPGSIISGIGALLAAVAAVAAAIFGFLWFPLKRLYRKFRREQPDEEVAEVP